MGTSTHLPAPSPEQPAHPTEIVPLTGPQTPALATPAKPSSGPKRFVRQQVPDDVLHNPALNEAIKVLPVNYNFEVHKTVWRLRSAGARAVALQFPEGLLAYAGVIADILERFAGVSHCMIMGDVTYGACCVDDFSAQAMGADFLVHYGHSCLVPVDVTTIPCLYVFVDIAIDVEHLVGSVGLTFPPGAHLVLAGTIQFSSAIQAARSALAPSFPSLSVPGCKPLSPGEVLGCTAPVLTKHADAIVFVADGRFHLEAIMIANPQVPAYRYDPYARQLTREYYDQAGMRAARQKAVESARGAKRWGLVLGTLGRQGNPAILNRLQDMFAERGIERTTFLISELSPQRLAMVDDIDAWVQIACPRLSIDWGEAFPQPTLTPYEALVALGAVPPWWEQPLPVPSPQLQQQQQQQGTKASSIDHAANQLQQQQQQGTKASSIDHAANQQQQQQQQGTKASSIDHAANQLQQQQGGPQGLEPRYPHEQGLQGSQVASVDRAGTAGQGAGQQPGQGQGAQAGCGCSAQGTAAAAETCTILKTGQLSPGGSATSYAVHGEGSIECASQSVVLSDIGGSGGLAPYPMDYYAKDGGPWNSSYHKNLKK